jgi:DNA-binding IclR family transcriptional regulator
MLSTLEELGMVEQIEPGGNYRIGAGMVEIAAAVLPGRTLIAAVRPHLHSLVKATGEAAGLAIADGFDILYLDQVDADNQVQVRDWTGERLRAHTVSSGQVLLAFDAIDAESYLAQPLERTASGTLTDAAAIRARLADVAANGYAWAFEEFLDGLNSVAAPIRDARGRVVGAIHAHGPAYRFPGEIDAGDVGQLVAQTAERVQL